MSFFFVKIWCLVIFPIQKNGDVIFKNSKFGKWFRGVRENLTTHGRTLLKLHTARFAYLVGALSEPGPLVGVLEVEQDRLLEAKRPNTKKVISSDQDGEMSAETEPA